MTNNKRPMEWLGFLLFAEYGQRHLLRMGNVAFESPDFVAQQSRHDTFGIEITECVAIEQVRPIALQNGSPQHIKHKPFVFHTQWEMRQLFKFLPSANAESIALSRQTLWDRILDKTQKLNKNYHLFHHNLLVIICLYPHWTQAKDALATMESDLFTLSQKNRKAFSEVFVFTIDTLYRFMRCEKGYCTQVIPITAAELKPLLRKANRAARIKD